MEDDDPITPSNARISVTVAAPSSNTLTLALPIQNKTPPLNSTREDCWTEAATAILIDAWGDCYLELNRGNLKQKHWKHVAHVVNTRQHYTKTDIQCKNRIDTVKKKYKVEKAKIASGAGPSTWRFYHKLDQLIAPLVPMGIPVGVGVRSSSSSSLPLDRSFQEKPNGKKPMVDSDNDDQSEPENSADSSDGLPPHSSYKRPKIERETLVANNNASASRHGGNKSEEAGRNGKVSSSNSSWGNSMREVSRAIFKFGEAYEQAETTKLQQLVEMEKQRMKFAKELELQRMQYFMKIQLELSQLKARKPPGNNNNHHGMDNTNNINNNNSDSSN